MSNFLEYSNLNHVNIIPQSEFEGLVQEVFNVISTNLTKSLGPLGSSAMILDGALTEATKDGYSILKKYCFHNRYKKMIYNLIMKPCTKMNNTVGDGTTTAIALTAALFAAYKDQQGNIDTLYRLPRQLNRAWEEVINEITRRVQEKAVPLDPEDYDTIYRIAYVTSNGDKEISEAIAKVYSDAKSPSIKQKDSPTNKSYISPINGFDFPANLISDVYVRNQDLSCEESDVYVLTFDHKIETDFFTKVIVPIDEVMRARGKKLIVLAPFFDVYMCETVVDQYIRGCMTRYHSINLILAQYELGKLDENQLVDLATILRSKVITQELAETLANAISEKDIDSLVEDILTNEEYSLYRLIGKAEKALMTCKTGTIFKVDDITSDSRYQEVLSHAKADLDAIIASTDYEKQSFAHKIYKAKARIAQLEMNNYIYYIGADSALQKQIIWDSVEDVIKCVRSAIKYGTVPGCQLAIITACNDYLTLLDGVSVSEETKEANALLIAITEIIRVAAINVYAKVLHGAEGMGMIKLLPRWQYVSQNDESELRKLISDAQQKAIEIINGSIEKYQTFDMESLDYNDQIITSAETDTMVLSAASELVKILISGNQCIFIDAEVNDSHQETVEVYV